MTSTSDEPVQGLAETESVVPGARDLTGARAGRVTSAAITRRMFASFSHRNYRLWFTGQAASLVGTWMQTTAQGFLIFQLTHSPAYLGYVGFAAGIPIWLFSLFGGVISDRVSRRNMMLATQTAMMLLAFVLAVLAFLGTVQPWHVIVLAFGAGAANAFDAPARQAFVVELVEREDLGNAIALNSTMVNLGTAFGPAIAGVIYALFGPGWCFAINGISFVAVIVALLMMRLKALPPQVHTGTPLDQLKAGLRYVREHDIIRVLVAITAVATIFGICFTTLLPAWAVSVLGGDSATNGFLQSARGVGSLTAALMIASLGRFNAKGHLLSIGTFAFPVLLIAWSLVRWIPLSLLVMVGVGWAMMVLLNTTNILLQSHVSDAMRGRVMGIYTLAFFGMMPVGALLYGAAAQITSEPVTVALGAGVVLAAAAWLWLRVPRMRALT